MLRDSGPAAKPDIQRAVDKMLLDDANFDRYENRSAHRKHLVRAVRVEMRETEQVMQAFSRNISGTGIGLVTQEPLDQNAIAVLLIASLEGEDVPILADCRWSKPFGDGWFLSGWQFIGLKKP